MTDAQIAKLKSMRNSVHELSAFACPLELFDALIGRLEAAEAVCRHVEYAFSGPDAEFMHLPFEYPEVRDLGEAYETWRR